ncbi:MAG TPA: ferritin-like domain-containing protein [Candidatus Binatia bacterium]|nr:ferritin-like domain-containing protein [Candidatus Binatia bacterium]
MSQPLPQSVETYPLSGEGAVNWDYTTRHAQLTRLYENAKRDQWNAATMVAWDVPVDPDGEIISDMGISIFGTPLWERLDARTRLELRRQQLRYTLSQFVHGEQLALVTASQLVECTPQLESKYYASTQVVDEARHVEVFARYLMQKLGMTVFPAAPLLRDIFGELIKSPEWDIKYLGVQVLLEGLALSSFHFIHDSCQEPVLKDVLRYVIRDEARHVAFGNIALRGLYTDLTERERREREEIVLAVSDMMFHRLRGREMYEAAGLDGDECDALGDRSEVIQAFRRGIFVRIVPAIKKIGLLTPRVAESYGRLGVLEFQDCKTADEELFDQEQ